MPKKVLKYKDYLDEDPPIPGQKFVILSFVGPNRSQKCDILGLKIRGVYDTIDETREHAKSIRDFDSDFDIVVGQVGYWLPFNPDSSKIMDEEYQEKELNDLVKGYRKNKQLATQHFNERKRQLMEEAMKEGSLEGQQELADKKEHPVSVKNRINTLTDMLNEYTEKIEELKDNLELTKAKWNTYSPEEIEEAELKIKEIENEKNNNIDKDSQIKELQDLRSMKFEDNLDLDSNIDTSSVKNI